MVTAWAVAKAGCCAAEAGNCSGWAAVGFCFLGLRIVAQVDCCLGVLGLATSLFGRGRVVGNCYLKTLNLSDSIVIRNHFD